VLADKYIVNVEGVVVRDGHCLIAVRGEEEYAPGGLALPGGEVEGAGSRDGILEETLRREILEETGIEVHAEMEYLKSSSFVAEGDPVVDGVFLCRYRVGTPSIADPGEVAAIRWMTFQDAAAHPEISPWTRDSLDRAERKRLAQPCAD